MKNIIIYFILWILFLSCSKNKDDNLEPGYFIINLVDQYLKSANSHLEKQAYKADISFDLGNIKKSEVFYFTLSNGGDEPIFDIKMNCDNSKFTIYPKSITKLENAKKLTILPILKIGALHGKNIEGLGYAPLMEKGENDCSLSIMGKTLSNGDTIVVTMDVNLKVFALVADLIIYSQTDTINFYKYFYFGSTVFGDSGKTNGLDKIRTFTYSRSNYKLTNIGNVPLTVSIFNRQQGIYDNMIIYNKYFNLGIGETSDYLNFPYSSINNFSYEACFKINSGGTISDINRLEYGDDGNVYFVLINNYY